MSIRKRNEFLEGDESDEEELDRGYDSDGSAQGRGAIVAGRGNKRRRTEERESDDERSDACLDIDEEEDEEKDDRFNVERFREDWEQVATNGQQSKTDSRKRNRALHDDENNSRVGDDVEDEEEEEDGIPLKDVHETTSSSTKKRSSITAPPRQVTSAHRAAHKSGVLYISRVPPFMKPQTLKHLLSPHASKGLGRIFLTPEDSASHSQRVRRGGNKKKSFTDGWVEFVSKKEAKIAAETLNGQLVGGKKGSFYHDDLWNLKYLKGFKWSHLTEQIAAENAERAARLREEVRRTKEENRAFVMDVERGKMFETREEKRRARAEREGGDSGAAAGVSSNARPEKKFKQKKSRDDRADGEDHGRDLNRIAKLGAMIM